MLPVQPETIAQAKARLQQALIPVYDGLEYLTGTATKPRPGVLRKHVFDFHDGMRLIISRDISSANNKPAVHVSASIADGQIDKWIAGPFKGCQSFREITEVFSKEINARWSELGRTKKLIIVFIASEGILHFEEEQ